MKKLILSSLFLTLSLQADKAIDAETLYLSNGCPSCHGFYAQGTNAGPRLQDQKEEVLLKRLHDLQQGVTRNANGTIMISFAKTLDKNQTKAMAHYLSIIQTSYQNRDYIDYEEHADGGS